MRLTKKIEDNDYSVIAYDIDFSKCGNNAVNKLGQLEDIEDELGIDLITLFKAHKNGIYVKNCDYKIIDADIVFKDRCSPRYSIECVVKGMETTLNLKDYGKTWALSRKELEKKYEKHTYIN